MQRHEWTFRFALWLKNLSIVRPIIHWLDRIRDDALRKHPDEAMINSRAFFLNNQERISHMLPLLADEKSRCVWRAVVANRSMCTPIAPELYSEEDSYFVHDIMRVDDGEVFVDGGAYIGDTIEEFLKRASEVDAKSYKIIAFEPNMVNFSILKKAYGNDGKIVLMRKGLSKKSGVLYLWENGDASKLIYEESHNDCQVEVVAIDDLAQSGEITWIKMDIEGAELDALDGARRTIQRNHPKLTICIYHSDEDMLSIIEQVHEMVPEYRLYVRHHSANWRETVLYAII